MAAQHQLGDVFASITWWNAGKVADLCRKLDAIEEAPGVAKFSWVDYGNARGDFRRFQRNAS